MQNKKTRIAIIIEVKKRELSFLSILEEFLLKEGYEVLLVPFRSLSTWRLLKFRPDIVVVNGIRTTNPYYYKQIALPKQLFNAKIVCYYSEQVGYYDESLAADYNNKLVLDNVDYHVGWGPRFCRDLEKLGVEHSKLWYLGSLQYDIDIYHKENANFVKERLSRKFGIDKNKKWILYADNIVEGYQPKKYYEQRRMDSFAVVKKVADKNPNAIVVFRPHPDTSNLELERIKVFFKNNQNIIFNNDEHVYYWTLSSDAVIVWCSTSSIQAMFLGKPIFGFMTSDKQNLNNYWYRDILPLYEDFDLLAEDIRLTLDGILTDREKNTRKARIDYVKEWYFKKDGLSFNRFIGFMNVVKKSSSTKVYGEKSKIAFPALLKYLYSEFKAFIGDLMKGRYAQNNVSRKEIITEKQKYDLSRYTHIEFEIKDSQSGKYLE